MVSLGLILEYKFIFPNEEPKPLKDYFIGAKRERVLKLGAFLLGFKNQGSKYSNNITTLSTIFGPENNAFANEVYKKIQKQEVDTGKKIQIFQPFVSLKLYEFFFRYCFDDDQPEQTPAELEINFFKAYLLVGSEFLNAQSVAFTSIENLSDGLRVPMLMFCMSYPYSDKTNYDIKQQWVTQTIKAVMLFKFMEADPKYQNLLAAFLHYFKCVTWKDYLVKYIPLTLSPLKKDRETYTDFVVKQDESFNESCDFLENFIIYDGEVPEEELDFLTLRSKPLYRIGRGTYRIIYDLFLVEKIYKGLYFALRDRNAALPKPKQIRDLKSAYGKDFAESVLTYKAIENIYPANCIKLTGDDMDKLMDGAPDYYVRKGKDILVFESKDFLVPVAAKDSYDFNVYDQVFEERLYFTEDKTGKQHNKAVMQLITTIKRILSNNFPPDQNYKYREINIYPIIVIHDHQFDTAGLRELINSWFIEELDLLASEGLYIKKVKPLVIVNVDQLLYFQIALAENTPLHKVIDSYLEFVKVRPKAAFNSVKEYEEYLLPRTMPFSYYLSNYFVKRKLLKLPPLLEELGLQMFNKEA